MHLGLNSNWMLLNSGLNSDLNWMLLNSDLDLNSDWNSTLDLIGCDGSDHKIDGDGCKRH